MSENSKKLVTKSGESKQASKSTDGSLGCHKKAEGVHNPPALIPKAVRVKYKHHPERGVLLFNGKGEHIKTVSNDYASLIKRKSNILFCYYPQTKRIVEEELNQFLLFPKLKILCDHYNTQLFYLTPPDEIFRNIVKDRDVDGNIETYFTATLNYIGNAYTIKISKPVFKNLKAPARINHRYMGDKYTLISDHSVTRYLYELPNEVAINVPQR
ncbi:MAG: hypothetical protein PF448_06245 [Bacteroidales bacterium]|jgi:hypothetical protein|nr:hypothetical protein [Bacteroidales bacterium]